ncbi:hypothetical protein FisN_9Hu142 [Fistulifera solaris]|uniref:Uncharacterized protein n=1 Tax=Fistulifera solaris TaxID=1519565 RepID=A0A1Z5K2B8_FISSO|nr:hypothetical protein FisN_9Hu142 [Fistulifera solaris]|eukprot:GAX20417.1 hypothetical protein FisN_9Hu142 [Fistulifera solaris]
MTYTIKRLREEGHFRLRNLDGVESLDVFWAEALKVERLYIEDTGVYAAPTKTKPSEREFVGLKCHDFSTELQFVGKLDDISSLRSVTFRVLCLPETDNTKTMSFSKNSYNPGEPPERARSTDSHTCGVAPSFVLIRRDGSNSGICPSTAINRSSLYLMGNFKLNFSTVDSLIRAEPLWNGWRTETHQKFSIISI